MALWTPVDLHEKFPPTELNSRNSRALHFSSKLLPNKQNNKDENQLKKTPTRSRELILQVCDVPAVCLSTDRYLGVPCQSLRRWIHPSANIVYLEGIYCFDSGQEKLLLVSDKRA